MPTDTLPGTVTAAPRPDPSNAPPHLWLDADYYGTAATDTEPRLAVMAEAACACVPAPGLEVERRRLQGTIGAAWLGTCGDSAHTYGYHVPPCRLPASDYSMRGNANRPVSPSHGCAIDIGMNWPAARSWLRWLIREIAADRITGIAEVIGSYDGRNVRYWSDASGWGEHGVPYQGSGHDTWTHVAVYRSTANQDHRLLAGWTRNGQQGGDNDVTPEQEGMLRELQALARMHHWMWAPTEADWVKAGGRAEVYRNIGAGALVATVAALKAKVDQLATGGVDPAKVAEALRPVVGAVVAEELAKRLGNG